MPMSRGALMMGGSAVWSRKLLAWVSYICLARFVAHPPAWCEGAHGVHAPLHTCTSAAEVISSRGGACACPVGKHPPPGTPFSHPAPAPCPSAPPSADKKLRHLDILHNIASDPDAWVTRDGDLRTQKRQQQQASTGAGTSEVQLVQPGDTEGEWEPVQPGGNSSASPLSGGGWLGLDELQLFLQHVALMRELDDLKDKVGGRRECDPERVQV